MNTTRRGRSALALVAASALVFAACGSDSGGDTGGEGPSGSEPTNTAAPDSTGATDTTDAPDTTDDAMTGGGGEAGEVGGSACGTPHGPYDEGDDPTGEVRVGWNQAAYSFNEVTNRGNAVANANPIYLMKAGGFNYYDADLNLVNNDQFGTCTLDSLDPLTITYTINEGVTWSDGVQVDAADLLMSWAAQSGVYNDADTVVTDTGVTAQADADGAAVVVGPDGDLTSVDEAYAAAFDEDGALVDGFTYKESTGVQFDSANESLSLVTEFPVISDDGLSLTATWDSFYVDYPTAGIGAGVPAHVVAQNALGIDDPAEAKTALIAALQDGTDDVKAISESWNRDFDATSLPDNAGVYAGFGPYNLTEFGDDGTMVFEAREDYTWGPQPKIATIVYSIIGDPTAAVQAMANEEVDVIQPQATADILTQLEGISDRGIEVLQASGSTYEHIDLAVANGGPFDPATYGGDADQAKAVRQAFLLAVPRADIIERLIVPLNENAEVRESLTRVPGSPFYDEMVAGNGSEFYAEPDPEGAAQILADAGIDTATPIDVRLLFAENNPRRASEYELIRDSVAQAGFNLVDGRDLDWSTNLSNPSLYDAALFGWQSTAIAVADTAAQFVTDGVNNFYGYSNPEVDALFEELQATSDSARQDEILLEVESILFEDAFGLPIFQFPEITAFNSTYVENVSSIPLSPTVLFDVWNWTPVG